MTNLYLSYLPNLEDPREPSVFLICPGEEGWLWRIEIEPPVAEVGSIVSPSHGPPPEDGEREDNDLVRLPGAEKKPDAE